MTSVGRPNLHTIVCKIKRVVLNRKVFGDNQHVFSDFIFVLLGTEFVQ